MERNPYTKFAGREMGLNDQLAIDRTVLANERTLLAYSRTALSMFIIGGTCVKLFEGVGMRVFGTAFIAGGAAVMAIGWTRYRRMGRFLGETLRRQAEADDGPPPGS